MKVTTTELKFNQKKEEDKTELEYYVKMCLWPTTLYSIEKYLTYREFELIIAKLHSIVWVSYQWQQ